MRRNYSIISNKTGLVIKFNGPDLVHGTIAMNDQVDVVVASGWQTLKQWVDDHNISIWEKKTVHSKTFRGNDANYAIMNEDLRRIFRDVIFGLHKSHESNLYSGRLNKLNYQNDTTGIYVCKISKRAIIVCDKDETSGKTQNGASTSHTTTEDLLQKDLNGFKELLMTVVEKLSEGIESSPPHEYTVFLQLYNISMENKDLEGYLMRSPLFWTKDDRIHFINFMYHCYRKRLVLHLKLENGDTNLKDWQTNIQTTDPQHYSKHRAALHNIFTFDKNKKEGQEDRGTQGQNRELYSKTHDVIRFIRNVLVHYDQTAGTNCDTYQVEEFIRVEFPSALPKIYLAMVRDIRGCKIVGQQKNFHDYLMSSFDKK